MRGLLLVFLAVCSMPVLAAADLHDATRSFDGLLGLIKQNSSAWNGVLRGYAINVFWSLASIQCVMTFYPYLFKQPDFGELFAEIVRFMLIIGFFFALLLHSAEWGEAIVNSFRQAGAAAAGTGTQLRPGEMFGMGVELAKMVGNVETWNPVEAVMIAVATVIILISFVFIAAFMQVTLIESYIVINASVFFMAFGGLLWTREYALSMMKYAVAVGAKLLVLTLIVGLMMVSARDWQAAYKYDETSMWTMCGLAFVCAILTKSITDLLQSLIAGVSPGGGSIIGGMAAAAVAGGAAGAAAASHFVTSNILSGGAGGVADLLKSSFGGSGGGSSGPSNFGGGGGNSGGPSSKVGGGGFSARTGSSGAPASTPPSAAAGQGVKSTASTVASAVHATGATAAKSVVGLAEMTVPGMEGASQAFASPPKPPVDSGLPVQETPENVIRPADAEDAGEKIDTMSSLQEALNNRGNKG